MKNLFKDNFALIGICWFAIGVIWMFADFGIDKFLLCAILSNISFLTSFVLQRQTVNIANNDVRIDMDAENVRKVVQAFNDAGVSSIVNK